MNAIRSFDPGIFRDTRDADSRAHTGHSTRRLPHTVRPTPGPRKRARGRAAPRSVGHAGAGLGRYRRARRQVCGVASGTWRCAAAAGGHAAAPRKNHQQPQGFVPHPKTFGRAHRACGSARETINDDDHRSANSPKGCGECPDRRCVRSDEALTMNEAASSWGVAPAEAACRVFAEERIARGRQGLDDGPLHRRSIGPLSPLRIRQAGRKEPARRVAAGERQYGVPTGAVARRGRGKVARSRHPPHRRTAPPLRPTRWHGLAKRIMGLPVVQGIIVVG